MVLLSTPHENEEGEHGVFATTEARRPEVRGFLRADLVTFPTTRQEVMSWLRERLEERMTRLNESSFQEWMSNTVPDNQDDEGGGTHLSPIRVLFTSQLVSAPLFSGCS